MMCLGRIPFGISWALTYPRSSGVVRTKMTNRPSEKTSDQFGSLARMGMIGRIVPEESIVFSTMYVTPYLSTTRSHPGIPPVTDWWSMNTGWLYVRPSMKVRAPG